MLRITNAQVEEAVELCLYAHKGQTRKGDGRPYIMHPFGVAELIAKVKRSKNLNLLLLVCLLHDAVEDSEGRVTLQMIAEKYGYTVAVMVQELTTNKEECKKMGKAEYLLQKMTHLSNYALCIKLADRHYNISDLRGCSEEFIQKAIKETTFILDGLLGVRTMTGTQKVLVRMIKKEMKKHKPE